MILMYYFKGSSKKMFFNAPLNASALLALYRSFVSEKQRKKTNNNINMVVQNTVIASMECPVIYS